MEWLDSHPQVLAFRRGTDFACAVNLAPTPQPLPDHTAVLLSSAPLDGGLLPPDTTVWLRTA